MSDETPAERELRFQRGKDAIERRLREEWVQGPLECMICGHAQYSVYWVGSERLECAACGYMNPNPHYKT